MQILSIFSVYLLLRLYICIGRLCEDKPRIMALQTISQQISIHRATDISIKNSIVIGNPYILTTKPHVGLPLSNYSVLQYTLHGSFISILQRFVRKLQWLLKILALRKFLL